MAGSVLNSSYSTAGCSASTDQPRAASDQPLARSLATCVCVDKWGGGGRQTHRCTKGAGVGESVPQPTTNTTTTFGSQQVSPCAKHTQPLSLTQLVPPLPLQKALTPEITTHTQHLPPPRAQMTPTGHNIPTHCYGFSVVPDPWLLLCQVFNGLGSGHCQNRGGHVGHDDVNSQQVRAGLEQVPDCWGQGARGGKGGGRGRGRGGGVKGGRGRRGGGGGQTGSE